METELLFQTDSYLRNFSSQVIDVDLDRHAVILDKTAFYPGGGGQPQDYGYIHFSGLSNEVENIFREDDSLWHVLKGELPEVEQTIQGEIDWDRRYQLMRTHTAMHILCGVIWRDYQAQVTGGNMEPLTGRMDFEFENMSGDLVREIEEKINREVENGRDVEVRILPREEANRIPDLIRTKVNLLPSHLTEIRTVHIKGLDLQADGGTHVKNTKEVGLIRITDYKSKGKINKRLKIQLEEKE
jgi:misacylated tRNA(Ala) deacylase